MIETAQEQGDESNEEQLQWGIESPEAGKLKCCVCGIYTHNTHRGGRYVGESYYCRRHAELVNGASARLANLWVTLQGRTHNAGGSPA